MKNLPTISENPTIQSAYIAMRRQGESHTIAEMLAFQRGPFLMTDAVYNEGRVNGSCFEHEQATGDYYKKVAERAGVSVKGKHYDPQLARFVADPEAWVSGRGDVQKIVESRPGWEVNGAVKAKARPADPSPEVDVAESLVQEAVADELEKQPEQKVADVREKVKSRLRPHWKRRQE